MKAGQGQVTEAFWLLCPTENRLVGGVGQVYCRETNLAGMTRMAWVQVAAVKLARSQDVRYTLQGQLNDFGGRLKCAV